MFSGKFSDSDAGVLLSSVLVTWKGRVAIWNLSWRQKEWVPTDQRQIHEAVDFIRMAPFSWR